MTVDMLDLAASSNPHRRRWLQFSLRTLLTGALLVAVGMGIWADQVRPYYVEQRAIKHLIHCGAERQTEPLGPEWMSWIWGKSRLDRVTQINVNADLTPDDENRLFASLRHFSYLRDLTLRSANLNEDRLRQLAQITSLRKLSLEVCAIETPLSPLSACPQLRELSVRGMEQELLSPGVIESLGTLTRLESLRLSSHELSANDLTCLRQLKGLRSLDLSTGWLADDVASNVAVLSELEYLDLSGNRIRGKGLQQLRGLSRLRVLKLSSNPLETRSLAVLRVFADLEELDLSHTSISNADLWPMAGCAKLKQLRLDRTKIDDEAVTLLGNLNGLEVLDLAGTGITDQGLKPLEQLARLRKVNLGDTLVTDGRIAELVKAHPGKLDIVRAVPRPKSIGFGGGGGGGFF